MAYGVSAQGGKIGYNVKHYTVDTFADMQKLPTSAAPGSTAFVVYTSQSFMLNNKREWVEYTPAGSAKPSDEYIIWDGGQPSEDCCPSEEEAMEYIWDGGVVNG